MSFVERAKNILVSTGASWILWLLVAASILSIAVIVERVLALRILRQNIDELRAMLTESLYHNGVQKSRELLSSFSHPAAVIALRGLDRLETHPSPQQAEARMQAEMVAQKRSLEQRFVILSTLGANAPFIGLLGTVIGILQAFDALGSTAASQAMAPQTVMVAIAEALVATAIGLGVAIPAIIACNAMQKLVKGALDDANILSSEIIAFLGSKSDCTPSQRPRTLRQVS